MAEGDQEPPQVGLHESTGAAMGLWGLWGGSAQGVLGATSVTQWHFVPPPSPTGTAVPPALCGGI